MINNPPLKHDKFIDLCFQFFFFFVNNFFHFLVFIIRHNRALPMPTIPTDEAFVLHDNFSSSSSLSFQTYTRQQENEKEK